MLFDRLQSTILLVGEAEDLCVVEDDEEVHERGEDVEDDTPGIAVASQARTEERLLVEEYDKEEANA